MGAVDKMWSKTLSLPLLAPLDVRYGFGPAPRGLVLAQTQGQPRFRLRFSEEKTPSVAYSEVDASLIAMV